MSQRWFIRRGNQVQGPLTPHEMKQLAASHKLVATDLVRTSNQSTWKQAGTIKGLFGPHATVAPLAINPPSSSAKDSGQDKAPAEQNGCHLLLPDSLGSKSQPILPRTVAVLILVVVCFPIGVFFVWRHATWSRRDKWKLTGIGFAIWLVMIATSRRTPSSSSMTTAPIGRGVQENGVVPNQNIELPDNGEIGILTTTFLPSVPGNARCYNEEIYDFKTGRAMGQTEIVETHGQNGTFRVERTISTEGIRTNARDVLEGHRRVSSGYAETYYLDKHNSRQAEFRILHGAKQGDQWQDRQKKGKYVFIRFQTIEATGNDGPFQVTQAVVEHQWIGINGGGELVELITEFVLEKGSGIQTETSHMVLGGQRRVIRRKQLIWSRQTNQENAPPAQASKKPTPVKPDVVVPDRKTAVKPKGEAQEDILNRDADISHKNEPVLDSTDELARGKRKTEFKHTFTKIQPLVPIEDHPNKILANAVLQAGGSLGLLVGDQRIQILKADRLPNQHFRVTAINLSGVTNVVDSDLRQFAGTDDVKVLSLSKTSITDSALPHIARIRELTVLDIGSTKVTGTGFEHLKSLANLQILLCGGSPITDQSLVHLSRFKKLHTLGLMNTKVTDAGLEHLQQIESLRIIRLTGTRITNKGLLRLTKLKGLEELVIDRTKVTAAGVASFRKALPNCKVDLP